MDAFQTNQQLIEKFYQNFKEHNSAGMASCYHKEVVFEDPAFGILKGDEAKAMWQMLIERGKSSLKVSYSNISADEKMGSVSWTAEYLFGKNKRKVINEVSAQFEFKDGLIIKHTDSFNVWKWSQQALGILGVLLGWSTFVEKKIKKQSISMLHKYMSKNSINLK